MPVDLSKFTGLYEHLFKVDYTGEIAGIRPDLSTIANVRSATAKGAPFLPLVYRQGFHQPIDAALPNVMSKLQQEVKSGEKTRDYMLAMLESLYAPVYQHGTAVTPVECRAQLKRFLAVVSNLYRSFIDANKRVSAGVKLVTETPPLAFFQSGSLQGPYTIESDLMQQHFGMSIGIVSLPATYRNDPVLWACLSHEVCGHDVAHADDGLVPEIAASVRATLAPDFAPKRRLDTATLNALIWSYWIDEAVADVYGVLNMGPVFPINLAAFLAAFRAKFRHEIRPGDPLVSTEAKVRDAENGDHKMDDHPIDILRLYLASGAIDALTGLSAATRNDHIASVEAVAKAVAGGATEISLEGLVDVGPNDQVPVKQKMKLSDAAAAARQVGKLIATTKFKSLNHHSIQDIETWDDADEHIAQAIADLITSDQSIVGHGDDAQLLAGTTLALLRRPDLYDRARALLNAALDDSYQRDPIWGPLVADHAFAPNAFSAHRAKAKAAGSKTRPARKKRR